MFVYHSILQYKRSLSGSSQLHLMLRGKFQVIPQHETFESYPHNSSCFWNRVAIMAWTQAGLCRRSWENSFWSKHELCLWKNTCAFPLSNGLAGTHLKDLASCQQLDTCAAVHRHAKNVHDLQTFHLAGFTRHPLYSTFCCFHKRSHMLCSLGNVSLTSLVWFQYAISI